MDESGTAGPHRHANDPLARYFGLVGIGMPMDERYTSFCEGLERLKRDHLWRPTFDPDEAYSLHREDIVHKRAPRYLNLRDDEKRVKFDQALLKLIEDTKFIVYGVVVDKQTHDAAYYRELRDGYHYAMLGLLERYCGRLRLHKCEGDVMAESRGGAEDRALRDAFRDLATNGRRYFRAERTLLTSKEIKLKDKKANIAGLQLADLLARDVKRDVLHSLGLCGAPTGFAAEITALIIAKYNRQIYKDRISGYGRIWLP